MTSKTGVMILKIQRCITGINYILIDIIKYSNENHRNIFLCIYYMHNISYILKSMQI